MKHHFLAVTVLALAFPLMSLAADVPDVEMKLSATTLEWGQELTATISSKVFCDITMAVAGLDDAAYKEYKNPDDAVFNPPRQYKFKFSKAGKYRIFAMHGNTYCGNMANLPMMADVVVKPLAMAPSLANPGLTVGATTPLATPVVKPPVTPKPKVKPCKKPGKPGVGEDCDVN
jgi:hypothetical protein